jgi:hypothetical protein
MNKCEKCVELQQKLRIVRDELSSVQLIIQMLNKERVQKESIAAQIHHVAVESKRHDNWKRSKIIAQKEDQKLTRNL